MLKGKGDLGHVEAWLQSYFAQNGLKFLLKVS